jgi:cyclopropane-fatty-acyl-phospholipid synthase
MKPEQIQFSVPTLSSEAGPVASTTFDHWVLARIQHYISPARLRLVLWDGYELVPKAGSPVATVVIKNRRTLLNLIWNPALNFGEAYMFGAVEVRGNLVAMLEEVYRALPDAESRPAWWPTANTLQAAKDNVHHHYDLGNDFYRLWLDEEMVYTCAYFPRPDCTLEEAQIAKMDLVCHKLRLKPGDRVVEAGCGWGSLALHMARRFGATVRALNLSKEQVAYARDRAAREGLSDRVEFIQDDYRNVTGQYDVFVSIGMLEHVGVPDYSTLGRVIDRSLTQQGRGLLHFIGRNRPAPLNAWIRKRIFPGGYPPTLREVFERVFEPLSFSVLDVENLRLHYAKTLEHWASRFEEHADQVAKMFDENFVRAWRLYLAGSEAAFTCGSTQLFQVVFTRGANNAIPWTRVTD